MIIATDATPTHWAFSFQGSGLPLSVSGSWSGCMCRAHIALQELQAVVMMLHRIAFCLSSRVVALPLENSTAKAYLCNEGGTVSHFLSRLACQILSLMTSILLLLIQHTFLPISMWRPIICPGSDASRVASSPSGGSSSFSPLGSMRGGSAGTLLYHSVPALLHLQNSTTSGSFWVECLQPSLDVSGKICVSFSHIGSTSYVQVSSKTC